MAWVPLDRRRSMCIRTMGNEEKGVSSPGTSSDSRAGTPQTSAITQGWRKGRVSLCRGTLQPPGLVLLHHGPPHMSQEMDSPGCSPRLGQQQLFYLCSTPKMWRCSDIRALGMLWSLQDLISVERSPSVTW